MWIYVCFFGHPKLSITKWLFEAKKLAITWFERFPIINESEKEPAPTTMIISMSFLFLSLVNNGSTSDGCRFDCHHSRYKKTLLKAFHWKKDTIVSWISFGMKKRRWVVQGTMSFKDLCICDLSICDNWYRGGAIPQNNKFFWLGMLQ